MDFAYIAIREKPPEEFWHDFDAILVCLSEKLFDIVKKAQELAETVKYLSDKDVGLRLNEFPEDVRRYIFPIRKSQAPLRGDARTREMLFRDIRPTGNVLDGYTPSYAINRVMEDANIV